MVLVFRAAPRKYQSLDSMVVFVSHSCGGWEPQALADSVSGERPLPGL